MITLMAPAGFAPSEVGRWTLATFKAVQAAFSDAYGDTEQAKYQAPFPPIDDHREFKRAYGKRT